MAWPTIWLRLRLRVLHNSQCEDVRLGTLGNMSYSGGVVAGWCRVDAMRSVVSDPVVSQ